MNRILFIFLFVFFFSFAHGQKCYDFQKNYCHSEETRFVYNYNNQSISYLFVSGQKREIPVELQNGKDYRVTICVADEFDDVVHFQIVNEDGRVIYDNSKLDYSLNLEFTNKRTQKVNFVISVPENSKELEGCIGFLLEEMITLKTGF